MDRALGPYFVDGSEQFQHFTFDHQLNGIIDAQGEYEEDQWQLVVTGNTVTSVREDQAG